MTLAMPSNGKHGFNRGRVQREKKVMSVSPGLLAEFCSRLSRRASEVFWGIQITEELLLIKKFLGLVEMTFGRVNASFSLPESQAVKLTFFTPWCILSSGHSSSWAKIDWEPGREGTLGNSCWECTTWLSQLGAYFRPKNVIFWFSDQTSKIHTHFQTWPSGRNYVIIT